MSEEEADKSPTNESFKSTISFLDTDVKKIKYKDTQEKKKQSDTFKNEWSSN